MWIKIHFNTYPNQRLHFVRLCWRSINQLSSIERFALTIWVWRAGVFQQISLSSLFMCVSGASVESTSKKRDAIECQLIHRRNWWNLLSLSLYGSWWWMRCWPNNKQFAFLLVSNEHRIYNSGNFSNFDVCSNWRLLWMTPTKSRIQVDFFPLRLCECELICFGLLFRFGYFISIESSVVSCTRATTFNIYIYRAVNGIDTRAYVAFNTQWHSTSKAK